MEKWKSILNDLKREFLIREKELETLHEIDKHIIDKRISLDETYALILRKSKDLLEAKYAQLLIRKRDKLEIVASTDPTHVGKNILIKDSISGLSIQSGRITNCPNVKEGKYHNIYKRLLGTSEDPIISEMVVPINIDNSPIGVINLESPKEAAFKSDDERMANTLATQAALAIIHSRLFDEVSLFKKTEQLLFSESCDAPLQRMLHVIISELRNFLPVQSVQILFRKGSDALEIAYSSNPEDVGISVKISDSVSGRAIEEKDLVFVEDVSKEPRYKRMLGKDIRSEIVIPIISQGEAVGVINIESPKKGMFDPYFRYVLERFSQEISNILMLAKLKDELQSAIEYQEATDVLIALGDQTGNIIHRLNNTVGAMKVMLKEIPLECKKQLDESEFLRKIINDLLESAEEKLSHSLVEIGRPRSLYFTQPPPFFQDISC